MPVLYKRFKLDDDTQIRIWRYGSGMLIATFDKATCGVYKDFTPPATSAEVCEPMTPPKFDGQFMIPLPKKVGRPINFGCGEGIPCSCAHCKANNTKEPMWDTLTWAAENDKKPIIPAWLIHFPELEGRKE